ncbi:MAG: T9SS type A sorting domain-containing protein [Candidatus Cloacimonetes bacterium]|nr:T9SS type A sorting domain-containing protein [Candidatus Cloacimonadota bacterium]
MKKYLLFILLITLFLPVFGQEVNGELLQEEHYKILKVWGNHNERGFAQGFLLGENIKTLAEDYFLGYVFQNNAYYYNYTRDYFEQNFVIDTNYISEAQGIVQGMITAGINIYSTTLQRDLDHIDLLLSSSITDISALGMLNPQLRLGCSSISSWDESTEDDPDLNGNIIITRNMDWTAHQALLENHLLLVHFPSEDNEIPWLSFTFPGFMGALSGINNQHLSAFKNVGNVNTHPNQGPYHPILLTVRSGIESIDYNNDGETNNDDILAAIEDKERLASSLIHCVSDENAQIVECNNQNGVMVRNLDDNDEAPQINGKNLVVTNHFRKLYSPVYCYRYEGFADSLVDNSFMTINRSWKIASAAGGIAGNIHKIQYIPSLESIKWAVAEIGSPAYLCDSYQFSLTDLFLYTQSDQHNLNVSHNIRAFPNPVKDVLNIKYYSKANSQTTLEIFNVKGQKIKELRITNYELGINNIAWNVSAETTNGMYFYKLTSGKNSYAGKFLLVK